MLSLAGDAFSNTAALNRKCYDTLRSNLDVHSVLNDTYRIAENDHPAW